MESTISKIEDTKVVNLRVKKAVFLIPWCLLICIVIISFVNEAYFVAMLKATTEWIINSFAWLFNLTTLLCVFTIIIVYISPLGAVKIGGRHAKQVLDYKNLIWVTLCTTIAAGILFWASAEPLYHFNAPATFSNATPRSAEAAVFAMKTMFLEWTWSPYAIYAVATILFAFVFYNMKKPFSIGSALIPLFGDGVQKYSDAIDIICMFSLVAGMAASLGMGTLMLAGGIENLLGIKSNPTTWIFIIAIIVITFIVSSVSGVSKGIRILSEVNAKVYICLLGFLIIFGPRLFMVNFAVESWGAYLSDFFKMSLATGEVFNDRWVKDWPIFYWCNWLAWTPITAIFLAKILKGHTVRKAIECNFIIPAVFSTLWMGIFSTSTLFYDRMGGEFTQILNSKGPEAVVYALFDKLPISIIVIPFYLFIVFISFVTASDSNTNALGGLCTYNDDWKEQDSPTWLKIVWGITIGVVTWILISTSGIGGIKEASNLGGFPNMFLMLMFVAGLLKICFNPVLYDVHKRDYDAYGKPLKQYSIEE